MFIKLVFYTDKKVEFRNNEVIFLFYIVVRISV